MAKKYEKITNKEMWNLDVTIAEFILPRLRKFIELKQGHPVNLTMEEYDSILQQIIYSLEKVIECNFVSPEESKKIQDGLDLFGKYFNSLWL